MLRSNDEGVVETDVTGRSIYETWVKGNSYGSMEKRGGMKRVAQIGQTSIDVWEKKRCKMRRGRWQLVVIGVGMGLAVSRCR